MVATIVAANRRAVRLDPSRLADLVWFLASVSGAVAVLIVVVFRSGCAGARDRGGAR